MIKEIKGTDHLSHAPEILNNNFKELEERVVFIEEVIKKYVLTGRDQFEGAFQDWRNKKGIFRSNRI